MLQLGQIDKEARCARPGFLASLGMPGALARGAVLSPGRAGGGKAWRKLGLRSSRTGRKGGGWRQPPPLIRPPCRRSGRAFGRGPGRCPLKTTPARRPPAPASGAKRRRRRDGPGGRKEPAPRRETGVRPTRRWTEHRRRPRRTPGPGRAPCCEARPDLTHPAGVGQLGR